MKWREPADGGKVKGKPARRRRGPLHRRTCRRSRPM